MNQVRAGGVCLLLILLAAALPTSVLAQTSSVAADSDDKSGELAVDGVTPTTEEKLHIMSNGQGDGISEKLMARNSGLKPLRGSSSAAKTAESGAAQSASSTTTSGQAETSAPTVASAAPISAQSTPVTEQATAQAQAETAQTETAAATATTEAVITPDEIPAEIQAASESPVANPSQTAETATPPENVTVGEIVSGNESAAESQNTAEKTTEEQDNETVTDRIWREGISPLDYTWTPQSFSGFFYDLKNDVGTEKLMVELKEGSRSIEGGKLKYRTEAQDTDFEFGDWGVYQVIGFMADKYFAGYKASEFFDERSLISDGQLRKVLLDDDEQATITTGSVLPLEEGYELRIKQIDLDGNKVFLALAKDGEEVDSKVVSPESDNIRSSTYKYEVKISGEDTPLLLAHISNVFASAESALVTVDGIFQLSDNFVSVEDGDKYDRMKVSEVSDAGVEMENEDSMTLRKGATTKIFGNVGFLVADADEIRFAPFVERTGTYDVRGTVIDPNKTDNPKWNVYNFEGFYYDIDDDVGTETLEAQISGGTKIEEKDLTYTTSPRPVKFEFETWGKYDVVGFMADKFFAGYNNLTEFTDEASAISEGQLRKVLVDSDDSRTIASGSVLSLEEGYELRIKQVDLNGNKVYLALAKDGKEVDSKVVTPSSEAADSASNYMYKVDMGAEKDVPIITAHIQSVFRSTESDLATVDGLFQVSDTAESVEEGEIHGKMKVDSLSDEGITMTNDGSISLSKGKIIEIMENLKFEVADSDQRLMAPIASKTSEGDTLTLSVPGAVVDRRVAIGVKSGSTALAGVAIQVDGKNIGNTDTAGSISYTPEKTGTFDVTAKKSGYNDAKGSLVVRTAEEARTASALEQANATGTDQLTINAPAQVAKGENFLITIVQGINQTPVEEARMSLDNQSIGNTSAQGTLTYSLNATGEHTLKAEKEGYDASSKKITVTSLVKVQSLNVPDKARAGQDLKIAASVQNTGQVPDSRKLELKVNDKVVDSKNVTLQPGENTTVNFSYKPKEPGTYRLSLDGQSKTVNVEKAETSNWLIALILVLLIAIGAGYYLYTTGELDKLKEKIQGR